MANSLKIIIFDGSFKTTPFINRLAKGLSKKHEVYILGFNEELPNALTNVTYVPLGSNQNKWRFVSATVGKVLGAGKFNVLFPTIKKLLQGKRRALQQQNLQLALEKISPDVIHLQWPSTIPWFETTLLAQKIPVVLSQRGFHNNVRPFVDPDNFQYLQQWYPTLAGFHSVSKAISAQGDKIWTSPNKIDAVVYTGLAVKVLHFKKTYQPLKPLQLLSIGRTHWKKGYDYALQACKLLKEKDVGFQYTILGAKGDEELQFLIHDLGLQDCVRLSARIPQKEVFTQMREASLLLMPSIEEGLPNVVVEAMAIGLPVLSTNCGGVPELIEPNKNGWMVPMRNPRAMAESIVGFTGLPLEEIESVRLAARKKVEQQHSEEQMIAGMEGLYREVVGGAQNPPSR